MKVDANIPVTYSCCINYNYNNGTLLDGFENSSHWVGTSMAIDKFAFKEGGQGLKLIASKGNTVYVDKMINNTFLSANNFAIWLYVYNSSTVDYVSIYFTSTGPKWSKYFVSSSSGFKTGWNKLIFDKEDFSTNTSNPENWTNLMNRIRIAIHPKTSQYTNVTIDDLRYNFTGKRAKLIINFDDEYESVYRSAYPILKKNNQSAVAFIITSSIGNKGRMNLSDLRDIQSSGWDISSHTIDHPYLTKMNNITQYSELNDSYDWLVNNNFQKSAGFIAYPYGAYNDDVIAKVKQRYIFGRATSGGSAQQHFTQSDDGERYIQRVIYVLNTTTVQSVKDMINDSVNAKLLGILLFHDIVNSNPSTYQYIKTDFQAISDYIKSRSNDIDVVTYSDYVIPNINNFTPVINKTTRIYSNGSSVMITRNKLDEYMPNMTIRPSYGSIDIYISTYNDIGGLIKFNESGSDSNLQVSYDIGDRIPNQLYSVNIYWVNGTQHFNVLADDKGHIRYELTEFGDDRYEVVRLASSKTSPSQNIMVTILMIIATRMIIYLKRKK